MSDKRTKTYTEQQNIKYTMKLRELINMLPDFASNILTVWNIPNSQEPKLLMQWILRGF